MKTFITTASKVFLLAAFLLAGTSTVFAQQKGTVTGTVSETGTDLAIIGANATIVGTLIGTTTDIDGSYTLDLAPGEYTLRISFIGFQTANQKITIVAGETTTTNFSIAESIAAFGDEVVVVGSRAARTAVDTPVPVDVIPAAEIARSGQTEVSQILAYLAPSFNSSKQTISDGTDHVEPASLRGLGPDQSLVLVNGKRRHSSALLNVNGTFGRGTVGIDLNAIPKAAIMRVEILRDGASAQYGSDAIAGVMNIMLKEQTENIEIAVATGVTQEGDGEQLSASANYGFPVGAKGGFVNVTAEFLNRGRTDRAGAYEGAIFDADRATDDAMLAAAGLDRNIMKVGQAAATVGNLFFNSSVPLANGATFYAFGGTTFRRGEASGFYRRPVQLDRFVPEVYPNGFLPEIHTVVLDQSFSAGIKGSMGAWIADLSLTSGGNSFKFNIENSINASIGADSPTSFDAGTLGFNQTTANLDLVRPVDFDAVESMTFAMGAEFRQENYTIVAGDDASWINGGDTTATGSLKSSGSQVFPGFRPQNEQDRYRNSIGVYAELETDISEMFLVSAAGRFERFNDFGNTFNGKLAIRIKPMDSFSLRGAVSTGFRAPSLHQAWFSSVSTQFVTDPVTGELFAAQVLTAHNQDAATKAFGIPDLTEEVALNISAGFTFRPIDNFSFTTDLYQTTIDDRIVLTSRFKKGNAAVDAILVDLPSVSQVQFFANGVDTKTQGIDIVAAYTMHVGSGRLNFTTSANFTKTEVVKVNLPGKISEDLKDSFFNREEQNRLEDALPRQKGNFQVAYSIGSFDVTTRATYFGEIQYKPTNPDNDEVFGAKTLLDLDFGYGFDNGLRFSVGGNNILNTYPDKQLKAGNTNQGTFVYSRRVTQFGMNGAYYYARLTMNL